MVYYEMYCSICGKDTSHKSHWDFYLGIMMYRCVECETETSMIKDGGDKTEITFHE